MPEDDRRLRLAIIGLGRVADVHYASLLCQGKRARLTAVCDVRPEAVETRARAWRVAGFTNLRDMIEEVELDGAVVLLPHHVHVEVMTTLMEKRIPVLLEKPLATTSADASRIVSLAEGAGVPVLVGHNGLFHPSFDTLASVVESGFIGRPLFASARSLQWLHFKEWDFRLSREETGGGAWIDCAGHLLYRLEPFFGEIAGVSGAISHEVRPEMEGENTALATVRYRSGGIAQVAVSYGCKLPGYELDWPNGCEQSISIHGAKGTVEYAICPKPTIRLFSDRGEPPVPGARKMDGWWVISSNDSFDVSFERQMGHFIDCLESGQQPRVPPQKAASLLRDLECLYHSIAASESRDRDKT